MELMSCSLHHPKERMASGVTHDGYSGRGEILAGIGPRWAEAPLTSMLDQFMGRYQSRPFCWVRLAPGAGVFKVKGM